jgi:transcriptional regulator with XRE-family HTH domain
MPDYNGVLQPRDDLSRRLGNKFREARLRCGLGQRPLAQRIGRSYPLIREHESGHKLLRADDLFRAAAAMGVSPASLLEVDEANGFPG